MSLMEKIFGNYSEKELKRIQPIIKQINALEDRYKALSESELRGKTQEFKKRLADGETLDALLPEAFATVREAAGRVLGMRHFDVQLIGGVVLHQGRIAEMKTGEGKTLVATLPAYLNALTGKGVHIVTVNDYLATRDSEWMGKLYKYLGMSVGLVVPGGKPEEKHEAYNADITYGTNNEFGFDYLRDNMVTYKESMVQRGHAFAIVDEVDSILVDEARTPLIISGMGQKSTEIYKTVDKFVRTLKSIKMLETDDKEEQDDIDADYVIDEKANRVTLTPRGAKKAEEYFKLENYSDPENAELNHHINQAIKAHGIMKLDINYVVKDGEVIIVDEFTGRLMFGRRYSEGLHQAIEAKENVQIARESRTLATITFQNYFRMYDKLSGMTGTALTEEAEFRHIYSLDVVEIPTNAPVVRKDYPDEVYRTMAGKYRAVVRQIKECHQKGQPVLVGTVSIENSELLSSMLKKEGIKHNVLNAKQHDKEAMIVAQAGMFGAVTIATNMAGRGTDIKLGGNADYMARAELEKKGLEPDMIYNATSYFETDDPAILEARTFYQTCLEKHEAEIKEEAAKVKEAGGLFILGTERHDSRRIDNQLRGRSGRQGDPGASRFYLSLEDDLMRIFGSEKIANMVAGLGLSEDEPISAKILSNTIENAQKKVEGRNFDSRKHVLEYDDVMNKQREIIYKQRRQVLDGEDVHDNIIKMLEDAIAASVAKATTASVPDEWDFDGLRNEYLHLFLEEDDLKFFRDDLEDLTKEKLTALLTEKAKAAYRKKEEQYSAEDMRELERIALLKVVDQKWMDHIDAMDQLRKEIGLRAYGQHDPVTEYKNEGFDMFEHMIEEIKEDTVRLIFVAQIRRQEDLKREQVAVPTAASHGDETVKKAPVRVGQKVGRNDPCPCGSGKKYKKCCGR